MHTRLAALGLALAAAGTGTELCADPHAEVVRQCLVCHIGADGALDIVGVRALSALPEEWPFLFEDGFDLDNDGIAGRMRFVSGADGPLAAKYGSALAAGRFEDFARLAGAAHGIDLSHPEVLPRLRAEFEERSPAPTTPFADDAALARFEAQGCARCHVTETFAFEGATLMPLSDFLLHDLGEGPRRTAPLWGCPACVEASPHPLPPLD